MKSNKWQYLLYLGCILPISIILILFGCIDEYVKSIMYVGIALTFSCVLALIIYICKFIEERKYEHKLQKAIINTNISQVDILNPYEFEEWVARFLRIAGYNAEATKKSGDYGVDVIAEKENNRIAVQVKKFNKPVGIKAVQEVSAGMDYYNCNEGWVVTTAPYFTQAAKNMAKIRNIKLYNKNDLAILLNELQNKNEKSCELVETKSNIINKKLNVKTMTNEEVNQNYNVVKPKILRYGNDNYQNIKEYCNAFTYKAIDYILTKFKDDNYFKYKVDNLPYIKEFIDYGNLFSKKLFNLLEEESEKSIIYNLEYVKLQGIFYVGMGIIYLWKNSNNLKINDTLDILLKKNGLLYLDETVLNKFKISIDSKEWMEFYEKLDKYQMDLLNDFDIDYIFHDNDLNKYYDCMQAMYILGMILAIQKLN